MTDPKMMEKIASGKGFIAALDQSGGSTPKALCGNSVSTVLSKLPGFESLSVAYLPKAISREFAKLPGVVETRIEGTAAE